MSSSTPSINLDTNQLASYSLANMPCSGTKAIKLAFSGSTVSFDNVESSYSKSSVMAVSYPQFSEPAFYIDPDGDSPELHRAYLKMGMSGYAFSVFTFNPKISILGNYNVGLTTLKDFNDPYLQSVSADGNLVYCNSDDNAKYGYQLIFKAPDSYKGDLSKAGADDLGETVLHEARFFVANRSLRAKPTLSAGEGIVMAVKARIANLLPGLFGSRDGQPASSAKGNAIDLLLNARISPDDIKSSYIYFIENGIHEESVEELKLFVTEVFESHPDKDEAFYLNAITNHYNDEYVQKKFVLTLDWKEDISFAIQRISETLGDRLSVKLPSTETFGDVGISHPDFVPTLEKALGADGLAFTFLDDGSDQSHFLFYEASKREVFEENLKIVEGLSEAF